MYEEGKGGGVSVSKNTFLLRELSYVPRESSSSQSTESLTSII